ncbi:MAG: Plug domain-containing protein [Verrucomicrobia bacterium]|nr:Plug domain-containing protein [Verrucomicrobiota bacterium]
MPLPRPLCGYRSIAALVPLVFTVALHAQADDADGPIFELSPFEVNTSGDDRYYASNAISGSRLDVRIQDMPLSIEVITSEFFTDTGSTNLRDALRYSAGIMLQTQNDAFQAGTDNFGGVNNPEGATSAKGDSSFKIRGFVTNNTLRNGFRRQHATDTINIDRVEVVRGPSALLYGVAISVGW